MSALKPRRVRIVRYTLPDGHSCRKGTPGAIRTVEESRTFYATIKRKRISLGTDDEQVAWERLRALLRRQREKELGIHTETDDQASRPFVEHVEEWIKAVKDKGADKTTLAHLRHNVEALQKVAGWKRVTDIDEDSALDALARLQRQRDLSARSRNHYAAHLRQFCRWLSHGRKRRLAENPVESLPNLPVETDLRRQRRIPTDEEMGALYACLHTPDAPKRFRMNAALRWLAYQVSMTTGLREKETRTLTRESFDLDAGTVTVEAGYSKHRRQDVQHLPSWLVTELREWFAAGGEVWQTVARGLGRALAEDLEAAGIARATEGPSGRLYLDYHSLRHYFCTQVASQPGMSLKTLLTLTRHSSAKLALQTYAKVQIQQLQAAVEAMPRPGAGCAPVAPWSGSEANSGELPRSGNTKGKASG